MGHLNSLINWLKELAYPYDYCVPLVYVPERDVVTPSQILKTRQNRLYPLQKITEKTIQNSVVFSNLKYSFFSPMLFVETVKIKTGKKSLLDYAVRHYIKKLKLFDQNFSFCYDLLSFDGEAALINLFVLSANEADKFLHAVPHDTKPVFCMVPLEFVLTQLLSNCTKNPVVSIWSDTQKILILVTRGQEIVSRSVFPHECDDTNIAQWLIENKHIEHAVFSAKNSQPDLKVSLLVWGKYYHAIKNGLQQQTELSLDSNLEKKITDKLDWGLYLQNLTDITETSPAGGGKDKAKKRSSPLTNVCKDTLFSNPSLFGLAACKESQTFISPSYNIGYGKFVSSRHALIASLATAMIFTVFGIINYSSLVSLQSSNQQSKIAMESAITRIKTQIPSVTQITDVVEKAKLKTALNTELNVSNFLAWITNITPEKTVVDNLSIKKVASNESTKNQVAKNNSITGKQYTVELNLKLNRAYADSVSQIELFFSKLSERVNSPQSKFIFLNANDKMPSALSLTFEVDAEKFF